MSSSLRMSVLTLLGTLSVGSQADTLGIHCVSKDKKTAIAAAYTSIESLSLSGVARLTQSGKGLDIEVAQYKNIDNELFLYSVMDAQDPRGIPVDRVVRLDARINAQGTGQGTLSIHKSFGGRIVDPVKVAVTCRAD